MDSITQAILGVAVANVTLNKNTTLKKQIALGVVFATIPDLDIFIAKFWNDPLTELEIHRSFSHSILFFISLSFLAAAFLKKWFGYETFKTLFISIFCVLTTHSLLDIFTTWGTQILWPYPTKFAIKSIFVVDLFYTIPLAMGVYLGLKNKRRSFTFAGLFLSSCYLVWGVFVQNWVKNSVKEQFFYQNPSKNMQITVKPTFSNSFLWNVLIQTNEGFFIGDYSVFDKKPIQLQYFPQNNHLIAGKNDTNINRLKKISSNQYIITKNNKGFVFNDLRFGLLKNNRENVQFAFSYQLISTKNGYEVYEIKKDRKDGVQLLKNIWFRLANPN